jgi:hypothetical protein
MGEGTEIVHRVAAQSLRHGASCTRCMRPSQESAGVSWAGRDSALLGARGAWLRRVVVELVGESKAPSQPATALELLSSPRG